MRSGKGNRRQKEAKYKENGKTRKEDEEKMKILVTDLFNRRVKIV